MLQVLQVLLPPAQRPSLVALNSAQVAPHWHVGAASSVLAGQARSPDAPASPGAQEPWPRLQHERLQCVHDVCSLQQRVSAETWASSEIYASATQPQRWQAALQPVASSNSILLRQPLSLGLLLGLQALRALRPRLQQDGPRSSRCYVSSGRMATRRWGGGICMPLLLSDVGGQTCNCHIRPACP